MLKIKLILPYTGDVSVNRYLQQSKTRKAFVRQTAEIWGIFLRGAILSCLEADFTPDQLVANRPFDLDIDILFPRKFSTRSGDATNFDKFPRDIVAESLGVDDAGTSSIVPARATYGNKDNSKIILTLYLHFKNKSGETQEKTICLV